MQQQHEIGLEGQETLYIEYVYVAVMMVNLFAASAGVSVYR